VVKTSFVEYLSREGCSMFDHTTMSLFSIIVLISLGIVFARIRVP
jgi:hypothetical protein